MYNLHHDVPYEGSYIACSGSLEELRDYLRANPDLKAFDLYLTQDADYCIYDLVSEARNS